MPCNSHKMQLWSFHDTSCLQQLTPATHSFQGKTFDADLVLTY